MTLSRATNVAFFLGGGVVVRHTPHTPPRLSFGENLVGVSKGSASTRWWWWWWWWWCATDSSRDGEFWFGNGLLFVVVFLCTNKTHKKAQVQKKDRRKEDQKKRTTTTGVGPRSECSTHNTFKLLCQRRRTQTKKDIQKEKVFESFGEERTKKKKKKKVENTHTNTGRKRTSLLLCEDVLDNAFPPLVDDLLDIFFN